MGFNWLLIIILRIVLKQVIVQSSQTKDSSIGSHVICPYPIVQTFLTYLMRFTNVSFIVHLKFLILFVKIYHCLTFSVFYLFLSTLRSKLFWKQHHTWRIVRIIRFLLIWKYVWRVCYLKVNTIKQISILQKCRSQQSWRNLWWVYHRYCSGRYVNTSSCPDNSFRLHAEESIQ